MKRTALRVAIAIALTAPACSQDTYVIGALCGAVGTCPGQGGSDGEGGTSSAGAAIAAGTGPEGGSDGLSSAGFTLDLTGSGVERLPQPLLGHAPTHFLVADDASADAWPARVGTGFDVVARDSLRPDEPGPFSDPGSMLSHAGAVAFTTDSAWAEAPAGALAIEAVFRGEPGAVLLSQRDAGTGIELYLDDDGRLSALLVSGARQVLVTSQPLVADAWHHCLLLVDSSAAKSQIVCNAQAGVKSALPSDFSLGHVAAAATLGSASPARLHWGQLARWEAGDWGPSGAWADLARERFARLVGVYAQGAPEPLPLSEVRASGAYIDMSPRAAPELRRLHPVGEHWPRIVCRPAGGVPRACGLLVELSASQPLSPDAFLLDRWDALGVDLAPAEAEGPSGDRSLLALSATNTDGEHALETEAQFGPGPAVFSIFARAASARLVRLEVEGVASAAFDLQEQRVIEDRDALLASVEPWGDGLLRLSYTFDVEAGPRVLRLALLAADGAAQFSGEGSVSAYLGDAELRFRSLAPPLPMLGAIQQADHLVYPAGNGNLPSGGGFHFDADIWLPEARLLDNAAIFNANFAGRYDQQINLFVNAADGTLSFWGLQGNVTHWQFGSPETVTDGRVHRVVAEVKAGEALLGVDGRNVSAKAGEYDLEQLDRIEVGTSTNSSGPLTGIISRLQLTAPAD